MYDELIKQLRKEAECPDNYPEDSSLMREAADAIEELFAELREEKVDNINLMDAATRATERRRGMSRDWRKDPITEKQRQLIADMQEFSCYPLPLFTGTTKGEASDYIDAHAKLAFENVNSPTFGY